MFVVRKIEKNDFDKLVEFTDQSSLGLLSLPKDHRLLLKKLTRSLKDFQKEVLEPKREIYFFVLEDLKTKEIAGCSAINAKTAVKEPHYFYLVEDKLLHPFALTDGPAELCGLYLDPKFRSQKVGSTLSLARLLFIASFPGRFEKRLMARIRGVINDNGTSPFWDGLGHRFLDMTLEETEQELEKSRTFINDFLPIYPIYRCLLSKEANCAIDRPHKNSVGSVKILEKQGFENIHWIDIFDGGPTLETAIENIDLVQKSRLAVIEEICDVKEGVLCLICNNNVQFRACKGTLQIQGENGIILPKEVATALNVKIGEKVRYATID